MGAEYQAETNLRNIVNVQERFTNEGLFYRAFFEAYSSDISTCDSLIVMPQGFCVEPGRINPYDSLNTLNHNQYTGRAPADITNRINEVMKGHKVRVNSKRERDHKVGVIVLYQPGVCMDKYLGLYSNGSSNLPNTERMVEKAILEIAKGRPVTYVGHSLTSFSGMKLASRTYRQELIDEVSETGIMTGGVDQIMPGVIIAPVTSTKDGLTCNENSGPLAGQPMRVGVIERSLTWMQAFEFAAKVPTWVSKPLGIYPLRYESLQGYKGEDTGNQNWVGGALMRAQSARLASAADGLALAQEVAESEQDQTPLGIVTLGDCLFSPGLQSRIFDVIGARTVEVHTGHRWGTEWVNEQDSAEVRERKQAAGSEVIVDLIVEQHRENLERLSA